MEKDRKLSRYRRKDYTEVVEFPVEIVGRDGVVRRYDYEASIQLYARRMRHAPSRFRDEDVVAAEQGHCRARIDQLRRSYLHLHGWTTPEGHTGPESIDPAMAGELAAFLQRVLRQDGRLRVRFSPLQLEEGAPQLWHVTPSEESFGLLVHAWRFDRPGEDREAFERAIDALGASPHLGGDAERLVAVHRGVDHGFALTGQGAQVASLAATVPPDAGGDGTPSPFDEIVTFVRRGDFPTAFLRCRWLLESQPWHREAYALAALLGVVLRRPGDAEELAFVGSSYCPEDPLLLHYLGLAQVHQGRLADAQASLERALALDPDHDVSRSLLLIARVEAGRYLASLPLLRRSPRDDPDALRQRQLAGVVARLYLFVAASVVAVAVAASAVALVGPPAVVPLAAVLVLCLAGATLFRRRFEAMVEARRFEDVDQALRRIRKRVR